MVEIRHKGTGDLLAKVRGAHLRGANLSGMDLECADLSGVDLRGADLRDTNLWFADLQGVNLQGADLRDAYLICADLRNANLRDANLRDANLQDANLQGADLRDAYLMRADLRCVRGLVHGGRSSRGREWLAVLGSPVMIKAGCRWFTVDEAKEHWSTAHADDPQIRAEGLIRLEYLLKLVEIAEGTER